MSRPNSVLNYWKKLSGLPGGKFIFSKFVQFKAPYFRTVDARIEELRPNYAKLKIKKRRAVENHIKTVHVIAICNLLEMAMGVVAESSIPSHLRWIPKGMSLDYTAKAGSDITGIAQVKADSWHPGNLDVMIHAMDEDGITVVKGVIKLWISEKPAR